MEAWMDDTKAKKNSDVDWLNDVVNDCLNQIKLKRKQKKLGKKLEWIIF